jgi:hypothetical protein
MKSWAGDIAGSILGLLDGLFLFVSSINLTFELPCAAYNVQCINFLCLTPHLPLL